MRAPCAAYAFFGFVLGSQMLLGCGARPEGNAPMSTALAAPAPSGGLSLFGPGSAHGSRSVSPFGALVRGASKCPIGMTSVDDAYCIDRYEATLEELRPGGIVVPHAHNLTVEGLVVRAVSAPHVLPQAFISAKEAESACRAAGKRLCKAWEWRFACRGPFENRYPYGNERVVGRCNDHGKSAVQAVHVSYKGGFRALNDPRLGLQPGTLAKTAEHEGCESAFGAFDMVGNVHEWVEGGAFAGGYYLDTTQNGEGCDYRTTKHNATYHDYSTGFRCCADFPSTKTETE